MKTILLASLVMLSPTAFGEIRNSNYEARHQEVIEKAVFKQCAFAGVVFQLDSQVTPVRVDQGVVDRAYTTLLEVRVGVDQYNFEPRLVTVHSKYYDNYDHEARDWGSYVVESVICD